MPALPNESSTRTPCIHYGTKKVNRRTAAALASAVSIMEQKKLTVVHVLEFGEEHQPVPSLVTFLSSPEAGTCRGPCCSSYGLGAVMFPSHKTQI